MELYFIMKTVLWKTVLIARQIYMYISLVMKCQQLQMKLLYSQNSNKNSLLFTKGTCFCSSKRLLFLWVLNVPSTEFLIGCLCKKQTWSLFSAIPKSRHQHGHLGISIDIANIFFFCLIKFYFKKWNFYVQYTSIFFLLVSYSNHIISACVNIDSHECRSWREYSLRKMLLHCF